MSAAPRSGDATRAGDDLRTDEGAPSAIDTWDGWLEHSCAAVEAAGRWRAPRTFDARGPWGLLGDPTGDVAATRPVVSFASNDYLGLSAHPAVIAAARGALERWGSGSGASRLVTGSRPVHRALEVALAEWKGCEEAVLFPTGFAANLSVLSVLGGADVHVFSDELNHASIVDGCRLAKAAVTICPHADLDALDAALGDATGRPLVVTDTVFSMDGDAVDLDGLTEVAARHDALLVLDEAHAVLGPEPSAAPAGGAASSGRGPLLLRVGTLSKTLGSLGGFVGGPRRAVELLVNRARPYIFTTAPTPADAAAALAALDVLRSGEGAALLERLAGLVARVTVPLGLAPHPSPIVPVVIGTEADAVAASERLLEAGLWVPAIRPPTVAPGTSRLRVTLSAIHTDRDVDRLLDGLRGLGVLRDRRRTASGRSTRVHPVAS